MQRSCSHLLRDAGDQRVLPDLYDSIQKLSEDPADYADPSRAVSLPFPSTNEVPPRFNLSGDGLFSYIGREMFTIVWETWLKIKADTRHRQAIYVYGTNGYGKSHILAALACLLIRKKEKVVYLPDCRAMLQEPLEYLRNALLFAFANSSFSDHRDWICECEDIESLAQFCRRYKGRLCFIIDQLNALDPEPKGEDDIPDHRKFRLNELLRRISAGHVLITSASANHKSAKHMASQDTGDQKIPLLGGMTMVRELFCIVILIR
jgi:energy-coupling factor transporter ATP-binding protein EcfA2